MPQYRIRNQNDHDLWWSNYYGWVDYDDADIHTESEARSGLRQLPIEGEWIETECV